MVAGFLDGIEDVAKFHNMATEAAVTDINAGARHVVYRAMSHGDILGDIDFNPGGLLFSAASEVNQAVIDHAVGGKIISERPGSAIDICEFVDFIVVEKRGANRLEIANKGVISHPRIVMRRL